MEEIITDCTGCCHDTPCGYFAADAPRDEITNFEENCVGCCCGDVADCNRGYGCDNYETEPIMG